MDPNRENLIRSVPFELTRSEGDGLTLEGYGAVFNEVTRINDWDGEFDEQIARGAFRKTLEGRAPIIQFDHGQHPFVGSIPIGAIEDIAEDARGLFVRARLHDNILVQPIRDAIASGAISGMSFRFNVVQDTWERDRTPALRTITEVKLHEVGPVVWPAYEQTTVGVRSSVQEILTDPDARAELARALVLGTSTQPPGEGTAGEAATPAVEPQEALDRNHLIRKRREYKDRLRHLAA